MTSVEKLSLQNTTASRVRWGHALAPTPVVGKGRTQTNSDACHSKFPRNVQRPRLLELRWVQPPIPEHIDLGLVVLQMGRW